MSEKEINIGWYSRDSHVDFCPLAAKKLHKYDASFNSFYICSDSVEQKHIRDKYGINAIAVISKYLQEGEFDTSSEGVLALGNKFKSRALVECLWPERFERRFSDQTMLRNLVGHFSFWESFIKKNDIDILISEFPSILSTCVAWIVCKDLGVKFLSFGRMPLKGSRICTITSWEGHYDNLDDILQEPSFEISDKSKQLASSYLDEIKTKGVTKSGQAIIDMAKERKQSIFRGIPRSPKSFVELLKRLRNEREYYLYNRSILERVVSRFSAPLLRFLWLKGSTFNSNFDYKSERYFLMPLHMPGEWSNYASIGLRNADQVATVREAANCLPLKSFLYVKEHTTGFGFRKSSFYREIKKIANVRLINPYEDTIDLIRHSQAVVTLGSTVGFEAFLMKKPVLSWGTPWYQYFPGMHQISSPKVLARLMQNIASLDVASDSEIHRTISVMFEVSFEAFIDPPDKLLSDDNIEVIKNEILTLIFNIKGDN